MNVCRLLPLWAWLAVSLSSAVAVDLHTVDRALLKEPAYRTAQPKYCLAVFGPNSPTRVWLVLDGDTLLIDRNGNLDLTEAGEAVKGQPRPKSPGEFQFEAGAITVKDGVLPKTRLEVSVAPGLTFVYCHTEGQPWQRAVVDNAGYLAFGDKPQTAPVLHFQGPLTIGLRFDHKFKRNSRPEDLDIMVGTPGLGTGSFVRFGNETVAIDAPPVLEIAFPGGNGQAIPIKTTLDKRC